MIGVRRIWLSSLSDPGAAGFESLDGMSGVEASPIMDCIVQLGMLFTRENGTNKRENE